MYNVWRETVLYIYIMIVNVIVIYKMIFIGVNTQWQVDVSGL